jgi:hypothetical protein
VRDNVDGGVKYHTEVRHGQFKDDHTKENIPDSKVYLLIQMYYIWKDYNVIDEIIDWNFHEIDRTANIKDMELWDVFFQNFVILCSSTAPIRYRIGMRRPREKIINSVFCCS